MRRTVDARGISIVEILVTITFLAIVALAALGLQVSAMRGSSTASSIQTLTRIAESELLYRRGVEEAGASLANATDCRVFIPDGFTCAVDVAPCALASGAADCTGISAADAVAHQVTVTTESARGQQVVLTSLVAGIATGSTGGGGGGETSSGGSDTGGTGNEDGSDGTGDDGTASDTGTGDAEGGGAGGDGQGEPVACVPAGNSDNCQGGNGNGNGNGNGKKKK